MPVWEQKLRNVLQKIKKDRGFTIYQLGGAMFITHCTASRRINYPSTLKLDELISLMKNLKLTESERKRIYEAIELEFNGKDFY